MKSIYFLTVSAVVLSALPVQANVAEISNPRWEEIPSEDYISSEPAAYFNANGIIQDNEFIVYDLVSLDGTYTRLETNCTTGDFRHLRQGFFETRTRVNFTIVNSDWSPDRKGIGSFICQYVETL